MSYEPNYQGDIAELFDEPSEPVERAPWQPVAAVFVSLLSILAVVAYHLTI